jgi:hypothetical protein
MTRVTTTILIVLVLMNGTVGIMASSGLNEDLGVSLAPGVSDSMDEAVSTAQSGFSADASIIESTITLILSGVRLFQALIASVFAGPQMFMNLGFPAWIVLPITAPLYIIAALEFIFLATGRDPL